MVNCDGEGDDESTACNSESGSDSDFEVIEAHVCEGTSLGKLQEVQHSPSPEVEPIVRFKEGTNEVRCAASNQFADSTTTLVVSDLPEGWKRQDLCNFLDAQQISGYYNFVYLPLKLRGNDTGRAFGYAFVNFTSISVASWAMKHLTGIELEGKRCSATWSNSQQSWHDHVERYRSSPIMHSSVLDEAKPAVFENGVRVPFPLPDRKVRAPRFKK